MARLQEFLAVAGKFLARRPLVVYTYTYADINSKLVLLFFYLTRLTSWLNNRPCYNWRLQ
ncbi:hypothetical protein SM14VA4_14710 [Serratia marcescens]|jgi:hypothetical protein|nr:hypothetical protein SM14VA4_14710 [Serratia marcescens]